MRLNFGNFTVHKGDAQLSLRNGTSSNVNEQRGPSSNGRKKQQVGLPGGFPTEPFTAHSGVTTLRVSFFFNTEKGKLVIIGIESGKYLDTLDNTKVYSMGGRENHGEM